QQALRPHLQHHGHVVLPVARDADPERPARHGALARAHLRLDAAERHQRHGVLPDSAQSRRRAGSADGNLIAARGRFAAEGNTMLDRHFAIAAAGSTPRTEVVAGITTFLTMAYIIFVNPQILAAAGMDQGAVFVATCLAAAYGSLAMGLYAN